MPGKTPGCTLCSTFLNIAKHVEITLKCQFTWPVQLQWRRTSHWIQYRVINVSSITIFKVLQCHPKLATKPGIVRVSNDFKTGAWDAELPIVLSGSKLLAYTCSTIVVIDRLRVNLKCFKIYSNHAFIYKWNVNVVQYWPNVLPILYVYLRPLRKIFRAPYKLN